MQRFTIRKRKTEDGEAYGAYKDGRLVLALYKTQHEGRTMRTFGVGGFDVATFDDQQSQAALELLAYDLGARIE